VVRSGLGGGTGDEAGRLKNRERSSFRLRCRDFGEEWGELKKKIWGMS